MHDLVMGKGILNERRILVVEDEALIALDLHEALRDCGAIVVGPAGTPDEALAIIKDGKVDCALLDIKLGDEDVSAVAAALERLAVPIIFLTAYSDERLPRGFETRPLVRKPYEQRALLDLIANIVNADRCANGEALSPDDREPEGRRRRHTHNVVSSRADS
jgi:CheY-like chemotaxis protein